MDFASFSDFSRLDHGNGFAASVKTISLPALTALIAFEKL
jgi:hypothetical protein